MQTSMFTGLNQIAGHQIGMLVGKKTVLKSLEIINTTINQWKKNTLVIRAGLIFSFWRSSTFLKNGLLLVPKLFVNLCLIHPFQLGKKYLELDCRYKRDQPFTSQHLRGL